MINLDDLAALRQIDTHNLLARIDGLPGEFEAAWAGAQSMPLPDGFRWIERIVIAGMGDAALAGDLLSALTADSLNLPVIVVRGYELPAHADGQSTLIILIDQSGGLEESFSALELADARGTKILTICQPNSPLADYAVRSGATLWPHTAPEPARMALYGHVALLLALIDRLGLVRALVEDVTEAARLMRANVAQYGASSPAVNNPTKRLAGQFVERLPLIYGAGIMAPVARRWKTQVNLNAKCPALCDELPEMNHNTLAGLDMLPARLATVCLAAPRLDHPRVTLRQEFTRRAFMMQGIVPDTVAGSGDSPVAQALTAMQYGEYVSYFLALLHGVDPAETPMLDEIKEKLAASR